MAIDLIELPKDISSSIPINIKVYKDECIYTFDTPENNTLGIDLDLKTFKAYSRNENYNLTKINYEKTGNYLYLNMNKVLKSQEERNKLLYDSNGDRSPKMQKLEVKNANNDDYYNTIITVYDIKDDKSYNREELSDKFNKLIDSILSTNSSYKEDEIQQWEQEILPCEHSIDVQQFNNNELDLSKCSQCELKENLWICLHCGVLGCGRQQYGSDLKGNGHALSHFEITQHPIAVKLGSLNLDSDKCDIYCYKCNEEIKVLNLKEKLSKFGIDLTSIEKTEKSLIELNIDKNLNFDFRLQGKDGQKLTPVYGKGLTGFQNLGNSCYLNSVVQALFDLDEYKNYFKEFNFNFDIDPIKDLTSQLVKIYDGLYSGRYSKPGSLKGDDYQLGIKPFTFKNLIGENHVEFKTQRQQDAFEFLLYLLNKLDHQFGIDLNKSFRFLFTNKLICANCGKGNIKDELIDNLSVIVNDIIDSIDENGKKIYKETNLETSFKLLTEKESIEGYSCDTCNSKSGLAHKSSGFKSFPKHLIINAQRIKLENWAPIKIDVPIEIPFKLNLESFKAPKIEEGVIEVFEEEEEEETSSKFEPNQEALDTLLSMGFPEPRSIKALYNTGNSNTEDAMNWLFAHMEDVDIDEPINFESKKEVGPSEDLINNIVAMGFSTQLAKKALILNNSDVSLAIEWLFSNPDDDGIIEINNNPIIGLKQQEKDLKKQLKDQESNSGNYLLKSVICHKGSSPHAGHYVVYIKKIINDEIKWVLFNDEKVVECDESNLDDIKTNAYIYIFERV
ncbi:unnamed protein product [Candida verbasci]|uniref:Ubiquitin carboxyl-terminal hydrolase n=1 Tax=Candida verbasci TaxID=1227364 RepID=A0A9W4TW93_9ASCO|nr:unnamed protein product [Candida verbasci]